MGGTMRSPFTGMVFTLELTHDLNALPALFIGSVAALGFTVLVLRRSILTEKLARRGQHISREYSVDLFELMRVGDVMDRQVPLIPANMTVSELSARIAKNDPAVSRRQGAFIVDARQKLVGVITRGDLVRALQNSPTGDMTVFEAGKSSLVVAYPDELLHDAVTRMLQQDIGRLPVVKRDDPWHPIGYLGRGDVLSVRMRVHEEEESRSQGPMTRSGLLLKFRSVVNL
jgi:chloride channel protein, CIC family